MNGCSKIKAERVQAFIDGELGDGDKAVIEEHIKSCPSCRALAEELSRVDRSVVAAECHSAPEGYFDGFSSRVSAGIASREKAPAGRSLWNLLGWPTGSLAAAAVLALAITVSRLMMSGPVFDKSPSGDNYASSELTGRQPAEAKLNRDGGPAQPKNRQSPSAGLIAPEAVRRAATASSSDVIADAEKKSLPRGQEPAEGRLAYHDGRVHKAGLEEGPSAVNIPRILRTTQAILICLPSDRPDAGPPEIVPVLEISLPNGG